MSNKENPNQNGAVTYEQPIRKTTKTFNIWRGLYNKDKNYILGRTPKNWGELLVFYSVFYIILALLFAICMKGLLMTLDDRVPYYTLTESRIGINPGLGFRPMPKNITQGSLIWFKPQNISSVQHYTHQIDTFLSPYTKNYTNAVPCSFDKKLLKDKVCKYDLALFKECVKSNNYGYTTGKPCIFLKLNRIFDWKPHTYRSQLPEEMPAELKSYINRLPPNEKDQIFVSCTGQNANDKGTVGNIQIEPKGFPSYFFPYTNTENYTSPLVSVQFTSLKVGEVVNIECRAWADNIKYHGGERDRQGSVHFEILIDYPAQNGSISAPITTTTVNLSTGKVSNLI